MVRFPNWSHHRRIAATVLMMGLSSATAGCVAMAPRSSPATSSSETSLAVASQRALEYLPDTEALNWTDPATGRASRVTVVETLPVEDDRYCRLLFLEVSTSADGTIERHCRVAETGLWQYTGREVQADRIRALTENLPLARL